MSSSLALKTSDAIEMVHSMDPRAIALPNGALITETKAGRATVSALKKVGLNLVALPSEALHTLQDGVILEIQARAP